MHEYLKRSTSYITLPLPVGGNIMIPIPIAFALALYLGYHLLFKEEEKIK